MQREAGVPRICFAQVKESAANLRSGGTDKSRGLLLGTQLVCPKSTACSISTYTLGQYEGPLACHHSLILLLYILSLFQKGL